MNILHDVHILTKNRENPFTADCISMDTPPVDLKKKQRRKIIKSLSFPENVDEATRLIRRLKVHSVDDLAALDIKLAFLENLVRKRRKTIQKIKDVPSVKEGEPVPSKYMGEGLGRREQNKPRVPYSQLTGYEIELVNAMMWKELDKSLKERGMI